MNVFGLIGYPLSHSFSKKYFETKFSEEGIEDCVYRNFEISSIDRLPALLQNNSSLLGLNITIPYKEQIIPFLHHKDAVVEKMNACNCICIHDERIYGFNTDVTGFKQSLETKLLPRHSKALVLGTGGASKAVGYVLDLLGIDYTYVSRSRRQAAGYLQYDEISDEILREHTLIVNTTPSGMYPHIDKAPPINYNSLTSNHYLFDLIYNPEKTLFLQQGERKGAAIQNGSEMLIIQAEESWKIWKSFLEKH